MHQLSIKFPPTIDTDELYHAFWSVLGALRQNGQTDKKIVKGKKTYLSKNPYMILNQFFQWEVRVEIEAEGIKNFTVDSTDISHEVFKKKYLSFLSIKSVIRSGRAA